MSTAGRGVHLRPGPQGGALRLSRRLSHVSVYDSPENSKILHSSSAECNRMIEDMNIQVAVLRDLLICVGKPQDSPEIRDKIKQTRKKCVDTCTSASQIILPEIRSDVTAGIPVDSQQLVNLVCCSQLLLREIKKCKHLISNNKMEMSHYYEQRQGSSGMSVLDKLVLWRPPPVNYHQDELHKIDRDAETVLKILEEMQEFMPHETNSGKALIEDNVIKWGRRRKSAIYRHVGDICCVCKSNSS